jgi:preprotein translocase subunit YajC
MLMMVLPIALILMMTRGQSKKQKQLESSLKSGDTVVTQSGLIGKLVEVNEGRVKLEIAPGVNVRMLKSAISGLDTGDAKASASSSASSASKDKPQEKKA